MLTSLTFHTSEVKKIKINPTGVTAWITGFALVNKNDLLTHRILELLGSLKHLLINLLYIPSFKKKKKVKTKNNGPEKLSALSQVSHTLGPLDWKPPDSHSGLLPVHQGRGKKPQEEWGQELCHREPDSTLYFSMC